MPDTIAIDRRLTRIRSLANALDSAIAVPGTRFRFGRDPLLGLVPGLGDLVGAALSGYIVLTGIQLGAPPALVARMIANVAFDTVGGSVPVVGDLFDAAWKSNRRNLTLIEKHVGTEAAPYKVSRAHIVVGILLLILVAAAGIALTIAVVRLLLSLF
jgi:hypothetical protein